MSRLKRPICDVWLLARPKLTKGKRTFYGAFPAGFLERARALLGVGELDPVLHVCSGVVRDYPFRGFGPNDRTLDLDHRLKPDFLIDVRNLGVAAGNEFPPNDGTPRGASGTHIGHYSITTLDWPGSDRWLWPAVLADPPYSEEDAEHYLDGEGRSFYPDRADLLRRCLSLVQPGGRVGFLDLVTPHPPRGARLIALAAVLLGYGSQARIFSVFERETARAVRQGLKAQALVVGREQRGTRRPKRVMKIKAGAR